VSQKWLSRLIRDGILEAPKRGRFYCIKEADLDRAISSELVKYINKRRRAEGGSYVPSILKTYHRFHRVLNEYTWLLKAYYSPKDNLKKKDFRLDELLQHFIVRGVADSNVIRRKLGNPGVHRRTDGLRRMEESLKKMWYNELAYTTPQLTNPFLLDSRGVAVNSSDSDTRFVFPSWRIVIAYYTIYHANRSLCEILGISYRAQEHDSPLRALKAAKLQPAISCLFSFPFNLRYCREVAGLKLVSFLDPKEYLNFKYASHPRPPHHSFGGVLQHVVTDFRRRWQKWSKGRQSQPFMLPDLLNSFRTWVNYVEIESMIALKGVGFRAYLDLDLTTIVYFYCALVELAGLSILGPDRMIATALDFHAQFIQKESMLWRSQMDLPMDSRFQIYQHLGRLNDSIWNPQAPLTPHTSLIGPYNALLTL
jgi:hypothetical protein